MYHIIQTNNNFIACVQSVHHQHARSQTVAPMVNGSLDDVLSKINPSLHQAFCRSQMSQIFVSYMHYCITPQMLLSTGPFPWSVKIYFMQYYLVISHCDIIFSLFRISQGSVATLIRWGGWSSYCKHVSFVANSNSEKYIKIRWFFTKLQTKISWLRFYGSLCIISNYYA